MRRWPSPHPEFRLIDEWNWNTKGLHISGRAPTEFKVRVFFDKAELSKLDNCPFPMKFIENKDVAIKADYCGIVYPMRDRDLLHVERWAEKFRIAEVFTFGGERNGNWTPGTFVRNVGQR